MTGRLSVRQFGFTMVELLMTLSLMTIVFVILFSMISGGLRVWQRLQCGVRQDQEIYSAFDQIRRGLHAVHPFELILFKGSHDRIDFPVLLDLEDVKDNDRIQEPGRMSYYFDSSRSVLCRSERSFRGLRRDSRAEVCKVIAENVEKVNFIYSGYNFKSNNFSRSSSWSDKMPPVSVKVELEYDEACSEKKSKKEFLVAIPVGPVR